MLYQPDSSQIAGSVGGATYCMYQTYIKITESIAQATTSDWEIVKSAIIGATVGFIATTILRLLWENLRSWLGKRYKFFKKK